MLQTHDTTGCFTTPALAFWMVPHFFKVAGEIFPDTSSHWYRRQSSQRATQCVMNETTIAVHKTSHGPGTVQHLRDNQQPVCHCTGMAGVHEMGRRLTGVKNKVVLLEGVRGIDCWCTLSSWFLQTSSKLFTIILEAYVGIVFLQWNSRETCLERGPSYFSK